MKKLLITSTAILALIAGAAMSVYGDPISTVIVPHFTVKTGELDGHAVKFTSVTGDQIPSFKAALFSGFNKAYSSKKYYVFNLKKTPVDSKTVVKFEYLNKQVSYTVTFHTVTISPQYNFVTGVTCISSDGQDGCYVTGGITSEFVLHIAHGS